MEKEEQILLANLAGSRLKISKAFNLATGENHYQYLRDKLKDDPAFANEVKKYWGLDASYPTERLHIHHKNFLKGIEPYFFKWDGQKVVMRPQEEITYMVKQLQKKGINLGNTKANLQIFPKELHTKDLKGALSTHSIFKGFFDFQGGGAEEEFTDLTKVKGKRPKPVTKGRQVFKSVKGEDAISPFYRQIGGSQIGMNEKRFEDIVKTKNIDKLVEQMKGQLKREIPMARGAMAMSVYLSDAPVEVKKQLIAEYGGKRGENIDEMAGIMRSSLASKQRYLERAKVKISQGIDPETDLPYKKTKAGAYLKDLDNELVKTNDKLNATKLIQEKIGPDSVPTQREFGFHRADSPYYKRLQRKALLQIGSAIGVGTGLLTSEAGLAMNLEDFEKNPTALNAAQVMLARGELAGEGLSTAGLAATGTVIGAPVGLAMMGAGEVLSNVAGWTDVGIDVYENRDAIWEAVSKKENQEWFIDKATQGETYRQLGGSAARAIYNAPGNIVSYYKDRLSKEEEEEPKEVSINYGEWKNTGSF